MMKTKSAGRKYLFWFLLPMAVCSPALNGQMDVEEEDLEELEAFMMTGTRLTGASIEGSLPITSYTAEEIDFSPAQTAAQFLFDSPIIGGPDTVTTNYTNGTDGSQGCCASHTIGWKYLGAHERKAYGADWHWIDG